MNINFGTKKRLAVTCAGLALVSALYGCSATKCDAYTEVTSQNIESTSIESVESTFESNYDYISESSETIPTETQPQTLQDMFSVNAETPSNPFNVGSISVDQYNGIVGNVITAGPDWMLQYGFDNEITLNALRQEVYNETGIQNDTVTMSDVAYFQGTTRVTDCYSQSFSYMFDGTALSPYMLSYVRAVMIMNGWRFGIDEIPYEYLMERFPAFMTSINETGGYPGSFTGNDPYFNEVVNPLDYENMYNYDLVMFTALTAYNSARVSYIYNAPYGNQESVGDDVLQVRDAETGRNVLVPTEEQYNYMMQDINSIPGCENVDIAVIESPETFYQSYGCYPEDLINDTMMYEGNKTYQMTQGN